MTPPSKTSGRNSRKSILICPDCEHTSHITGDWETDDTTDEHRLICPDCGLCILGRTEEPMPA